MKLSLPQQDIYFEQLLYPGEPIYNIGAQVEIKGQLDTDVLKKAVYTTVQQHDAYRTVLTKGAEDPEIHFHEIPYTELLLIDFSGEPNPVEQAMAYMRTEFLKPFELCNGNHLFFFSLIRIKADLHYFFSCNHHIITDGWGTSLMFQRLVQNYNEIAAHGEATTLYPYSYKDFIEEDATYLHSEAFQLDKKYWVQKFSNLPENLLNKIDPSLTINKSQRKELILKREVYNHLNNLAARYKSSAFHVILGILYTYFGRKHQNTDFAIGLPVLNRSKAHYKKTVGLFMGISPLRLSLDFNASFSDLLNNIRNQLRADYRHQRFPLGKLIHELQLFSEKERLFNITLSYEKQDYAHHFLHTQTKVTPLTHQSERVALAIYVREFDEHDDVKIDFDYHLNYFDEKRIGEVVRHVEKLLTAILKDPDKKLNELHYLSDEEEDALLNRFNSTKREIGTETVIDLFKSCVKQFPAKIALSDEQHSYTYSALDLLSRQVAAYLSKAVTDDQSPVAVLLSRSAHLVGVLMGILRSGRAYIPLDPSFPEERLNYILKNSGCKVLIAEKAYDDLQIEKPLTFLLEDLLTTAPLLYAEESLPAVTMHSTAYIIYTSGSTGNPKGVEIGHHSLINFLKSIQEKPGFTTNDHLFAVTTYSFDISILEFFVPLISGGSLYIASQQTLSDPLLIIRQLQQVKPTIIQATPGFYQLLFHAGWTGDPQVKVLCGGDLLSDVLAEKLLQHHKEVWNMYGPTETTIWSSIKKLVKPTDAGNIGTPIYNTQFYILDAFLKPLPVGTYGAIYIGGTGLAKGYYKNESLTAQRFIQNPFNDSDLIYETGDMGKWTDEGEILFLGRNDHQVKIRGYRIELGDIEAHLNQLKGIRQSVVIARKHSQQEAFLVAYLLGNEEMLSPDEIQAELKKQLPAYMIPSVIIPLDAFPLTLNQKVDRKALSQLNEHSWVSTPAFRAPVSSLEKQLSQLWKDALNHSGDIGLTDNFFSLGGHSLSAVRLTSLIATHLRYTISLKTVFDHPTIESMAAHLQQLDQGSTERIEQAVFKDLYPATASQHGIWLASQQPYHSIAYHMAAAYEMKETPDLDFVQATIRELIQANEILRTNFIEKNGGLYQCIQPEDQTNFSINRFAGVQDIDAAIASFINQEFDLENELLIRVQFVETKDNRFFLLFCMHHLIMDGTSVALFVEQLAHRYKGQPVARGEFQFKDYSEWQHKKISKVKAENDLFWKQYLEGYRAQHFFDHEFIPPQNKQPLLKRQIISFTKTDVAELKGLAAREQVTNFTILLAGWKLLVHQLYGFEDICVASINSGRTHPELEKQLGLFVKTFLVRTHLHAEKTFSGLLTELKQMLSGIDAYPDVPFDLLSETAFDTILVYQHTEFDHTRLPALQDLQLTYYPSDNLYSRVPLVLNFFENASGLSGVMEYNSALFDEESMQLIASKFMELIRMAGAAAGERIASIHLPPMALQPELDFDFNF